jgi:hypothetical protein
MFDLCQRKQGLCLVYTLEISECYISRIAQRLEFILREPIRERSGFKKRHMKFHLDLWLCPFKSCKNWGLCSALWHGFWAGRDFNLAVTRRRGFSGLIRRTAPFSSLFRHVRGCRGPILIWILMGPHSVASYDTQRYAFHFIYSQRYVRYTNKYIHIYSYVTCKGHKSTQKRYIPDTQI